MSGRIKQHGFFLRIEACFVIGAIVSFGFFAVFSGAQDRSTTDEHTMSMPMNEAVSLDEQAKLLSDKLESEFNHHLAGLLVVFAGLLILAEPKAGSRFYAIRYAWPACFLLAGLFLLVFSDTELWPFGEKSWIRGVAGNPEVLQHKIFAILLLGLGLTEFARTRGRLKAAWAAWIFPFFAVTGSLLLLVHSHDVGMHAPDHMTLMAHIQKQHFRFAMIGTAIGVTKGLSEISKAWRSLFSVLWPALMILLGFLLMSYTE